MGKALGTRLFRPANFSRAFYFRVFASSPLSESLEQATFLKELCHKIYQTSNSESCQQIRVKHKNIGSKLKEGINDTANTK